MKISIFGLVLPLALALALSGCQSRVDTQRWDVPSFIGQPIDVVAQKLGQPQKEAAPASGLEQGRWQSADVSLSATWKTSSKRVTAWTLIARDQAHAINEEEKNKLLVVGNFKENDPRYALDWIEAPDRPLFYIGVRAVPAPKNHATTIRVSGSTALLDVSYQVTGPQNQADNFITIAPWEASFNLADDSQIQVAAQIRKNLGRDSNMKIEIVVDGQVVANATSTGQPIQCQYEI